MIVTLRFGQGGGTSYLPATATGSLHYRHPLETRIRAAVRRCIADEIQRLVDMLDEYDGDPDFEIPDDDEPSLGLPNPEGENCVLFNSHEMPDAGPLDDDRELDEADWRLEDISDEREINADIEPLLGWTRIVAWGTAGDGEENVTNDS